MEPLNKALDGAQAGLAKDLFAAFFERGLEACLLTRPGGSVVAVNNEARRLFGYTADELIAQGRGVVTVPEDPRLAELLAERERAGSVRGRLTMRRKDGSRFEAEVSSSIFRVGADDRYTTVLVRDLTGSLLAEKTTRESEERLRFALDATGMGYWDTDLVSGEAYRSASLFALFGFAAPVPGWNFASFTKCLHADDRDRVAAAYRAAIHAGGLYDEEFRVIWPDGSIHWMWAKGRVHLDAQGVPRRMLGLQIDISARQEALQRLSESEERFRMLADAAPVMIWMTEPDKSSNFCSRAWLEFTGRTMDEALGNGWMDALHPEDRQGVADAFGKAFDARAIYRQEYRMRDAQGSFRWLLVEARPRYDSGGVFLGYIGSSLDITQRKEAELALQRTEERLRLVIEGSNDAPWDWNLETDELYYSPRWWAMLGYATDALPTDAGLWARLLHPDDKARVDRVFGAALAGPGNVYEVEFRLRHKDGHYVPVLSRGYLLRDAAGKPVRASGTNMDLTERKHAERALAESEQKHRFLIDHLNVGVVVHEADSTISLSNAAASRMLGLTIEQMHGREALDIGWSFRREDGSRMPVEEYPVVRVLATHQPLTGYVLGIERAGGGKRAEGGERTWVLVNAFPKLDVHQTLAQVVVTFADITALKRAEILHRELETQLRESQKMEAIGTLAGGIAHDFNNIVGAILGNAELARQDAGGHPALLQSLDEIRKAGERARDLVRQILSFSRRQPTSRVVIALPPRIEEVARLLRATLLAQATIECNYAQDLPNVYADPVQVDQVLINLVTNAAHALDGRPGRITISVDAVHLNAEDPQAHFDLRSGRYARVAVRDTGRGMDEETRKHIFEPFFTTKPVGMGTGLGLSVVYGIMQAHGGAVTVHSEPGQGSTFTLYFPDALALAASLEPASAPAAATDGRARRVLYIDDDEALIFLVQRLLERRGYVFTGFSQPQQGLAALRADPLAWDLVLTDYNMPGMTGLDVARAVRQVRPDLPVAVASGFITDEMRAQAASLGVRDLIFKPNAVEEYCDAVDRLALERG